MKKYLIWLLLILIPIYAENLKRTRLAQAVLTTNAVSIYSPPDGKSAIIQNILVCNTASSAKTVFLYLDNTGTTYTASTAFLYEVSVNAFETMMIDTAQDSGIYMTNASGNLAGKCSANSAVTVTVMGEEVIYG